MHKSLVSFRALLPEISSPFHTDFHYLSLTFVLWISWTSCHSCGSSCWFAPIPKTSFWCYHQWVLSRPTPPNTNQADSWHILFLVLVANSLQTHPHFSFAYGLWMLFPGFKSASSFSLLPIVFPAQFAPHFRPEIDSRSSLGAVGNPRRLIKIGLRVKVCPPRYSTPRYSDYIDLNVFKPIHFGAEALHLFHIWHVAGPLRIVYNVQYSMFYAVKKNFVAKSGS